MQHATQLTLFPFNETPCLCILTATSSSTTSAPASTAPACCGPTTTAPTSTTRSSTGSTASTTSTGRHADACRVPHANTSRKQQLVRIVPMTRTKVLINLRGARGNGGTGTFAFGSDKSYLPLKFNSSLDQNVFFSELGSCSENKNTSNFVSRTNRHHFSQGELF